jgi:hypothetical protein
VDRIDEADFVVAGFIHDIREGSAELAHLLRRRPQASVVVLSEEPLWDSVWSGTGWTASTVRIGSAEGAFTVHQLNHCTSSIYRYSRIPYFVTTRNDFAIRYASLLARNARLGAEGIRARWRRAPIAEAYFAERREGEQFEVCEPRFDLRGLCTFRTQLAESAESAATLRQGAGWEGNTVRRQNLPDWHLDKLAQLDCRARIVSALENTHHPDYVTEKLFDAYAVLGLPLYYAAPGHSVFRLVAPESFINLHGLSPQEARGMIASFETSGPCLDAYRSTLSSLASLFKDTDALLDERRRVVQECVAELRRIGMAAGSPAASAA